MVACSALALLLVGHALPLSFKDLLVERDGRLAPSARLLAAAGRQVRIQGYVANLENPPKGGFWLVPFPVEGDESGGGTADLPAESLFVVVRSSPKTEFRPPKRPVVVTGLLEVGPKALADGTMTHLRLLLDRAPAVPTLPRPAPLQSKRKP